MLSARERARYRIIFFVAAVGGRERGAAAENRFVLRMYQGAAAHREL